MKRLRFLLLIAALLLPSLLRAETVYVIDKLLVGVHSGKTLDSPIIKVFPTGTQLQVLKRDGDLAQIKGPGNVTGWVDASYLTKDQPASVVLDMIETQNHDLVKNLKDAKDKVTALEAQLAKTKAPAGGKAEAQTKADLARLQKENASLQAALTAEQSKTEALQSKLNAAPPAANAAGAADVLAQLRHENATLKQALAEARQAASGSGENSETPRENEENPLKSSLAATATMGKRTLQHLGAWAVSPVSALIVFVVLLLGSFFGGVSLMDYIHRKRHGGFRV